MLILLILNSGGLNGYGQISITDFGQIDPDYYLFSADSASNRPLMLNVIIANLPQLLISHIYVYYSGLVTCMLLTREYLSYSKHRKGLRVSVPHGAQRSTPWLNVPYRFALPFAAGIALLHWSISESIFLVSVDVNDRPYLFNGTSNKINTCGWSPPAVIVALVLWALLMLGLFALGLRKQIVTGMPLASTCSAAISAACHRSTLEDKDAALKPIKYGVLPDLAEGGRKMVGFSAKDVGPLKAWYVNTCHIIYCRNPC